MKKIMDKIYNPKVLYVYILLFPLFEVITSFMVRNDISFTFGMIYKSAFVIYVLGYILFASKCNKKINYVYMAFLLSLIIISSYVISGYEIRNIDGKLFKSIIKYINFPVMLIFFYTYFKDKREFNSDMFEYSIFIYCISIVIAVITGTSQPTYLLMEETVKLGYKGWFFAGNEIGNLLGIMYPLAIYLACVKKKYKSVILLTIITFCTAEVGTKTASLSIIITIVIMLIFSIVMSVMSKDETIIKLRKISMILLAVLVMYAPFSTSYKIFKIRVQAARNTNIQELMMEDVNDELVIKDKNITDEENKMEEQTVTSNGIIQQVIYSGRQEYQEYQEKRFKESSVVNKLFGLENKNNNIEGIGSFDIIERDFHDILYSYGIIGSAIFFLPVIYMLVKIAINIVKNIKKIDIKIVASCTSIMLALSIAYIAGHVLLTPSIVMFVSATIAGLVTYLENMESSYKEN